MSTLIQLAVSFAVSLVSFIVLAAAVEAMRLRGFDPIAKLARVVSPEPEVEPTPEPIPEV